MSFDFGEGSQGQQWQPAPGWEYAGDAWCFGCGNYKPAERQGAQARVAQHTNAQGQGCPGSLRAIQAPRQREEF